MQFSIRSFLFAMSLTCGVLAWMAHHDLSYQWILPWRWQELSAALLIGIALWKRKPASAAWAVAALVLCVWAAIWNIYSMLMYSHSSDGNIFGKPWMIEHMQQGSAAVVVWPTVVATVCLRVMLRDIGQLLRRQWIALSGIALLSLVLLAMNIYFLNRLVRG
jgi:hypothetical protein